MTQSMLMRSIIRIIYYHHPLAHFLALVYLDL